MSTAFAPAPRPTTVGGWRASARRWLVWGLLGVYAAILFGAESSRIAAPAGVAARGDIPYRSSGDPRARLDLYLPEGSPPERGWPVVVAIHGGAWRGGDHRDYGRRVASLATRGIAVASVGYRLSAPGRPSWPGNLEDVRESVRWLRRNSDRLGLDPARIAALGASAGGHLAGLLGTRGDEDPEARVAAVIAFYGPSDLEALHAHLGPHGPVAPMLGGSPARAADRYEAASPLRHVSADDPPMLLIHGDRDRTVPLDQSSRLAEALGASGVRHRLIVVGGAAHAFGLEVAGRDLSREILDFLAESWDDKR